MERKMLKAKRSSERVFENKQHNPFLKRTYPLEGQLSNSPLKRPRQEDDNAVASAECQQLTKKVDSKVYCESKRSGKNIAAARLQSLRDKLHVQQLQNDNECLPSMPSTSRWNNPNVKSDTVKSSVNPKYENRLNKTAPKHNAIESFPSMLSASRQNESHVKLGTVKGSVNTNYQNRLNKAASKHKIKVSKYTALGRSEEKTNTPKSESSVQLRLLKFKSPTFNKSSTSSCAFPPNPSINSSIQNTVKVSEDAMSGEMMEWEPINEEQILKQIREVRKQLPNVESPLSVTTQNLLDRWSQKAVTATDAENLNIVVDTNVFISNLKVIQGILNVDMPVKYRPVLIVPWTVIQELDFMKDGRSKDQLKCNAQSAIKLINDLLTVHSPSLKCQTAFHAAKNDILQKHADDEILYCCLTNSETSNTLLLSNDINLRNKALIHNVNAYSGKDIINFLIYDYKKNLQLPKATTIKNELTNLFYSVIINDLKRVFGARYDSVKFSGMIYSVEESLECFQYHWDMVFSKSLPDSCLLVIRDFHQFLQGAGFIKEENFIKFMEFSFSFCVYLKVGYPKLKPKIMESMDKLKILADS